MPVSFARAAGSLRKRALRIPTPRSHPHLEALTGYWNVIYELLDRAGVPPGTVEDLPRSAREAGFEVAGMNGCFLTGDPEVFGLHAATLAAARDRATRAGIAGDGSMIWSETSGPRRMAATSGVSSPFYLDLALRKV